MKQLPKQIKMTCPTCGREYVDFHFWTTCIHCRRKENIRLYNQAIVHTAMMKQRHFPNFEKNKIDQN